MPQTMKTSAMETIRLFMKGESLIIAPVSGLRSGAPGGSSSRPISTATRDQPAQREAQAAILGLRQGVLAGHVRNRRV